MNVVSGDHDDQGFQVSVDFVRPPDSHKLALSSDSSRTWICSFASDLAVAWTECIGAPTKNIWGEIAHSPECLQVLVVPTGDQFTLQITGHVLDQPVSLLITPGTNADGYTGFLTISVPGADPEDTMILRPLRLKLAPTTIEDMITTAVRLQALGS